jgi:hypothetical protein
LEVSIRLYFWVGRDSSDTPVTFGTVQFLSIDLAPELEEIGIASNNALLCKSHDLESIFDYHLKLWDLHTVSGADKLQESLIVLSSMTIRMMMRLV